MSRETNGNVVVIKDVVNVTKQASIEIEDVKNDVKSDEKSVVVKRHDFLFKIILLGDTQTGKTNLLSRFIDNSFHDNSLPTIGVDFKTKIIHVNDKSVKLQIWDTAGKQKYESMSELFYRGVMGVIYCFDLTNNHTFKNIDKWVHKLTNSTHYDDKTKCFSAIVGCKSDLATDREVTADKGQELAIRLGGQYFEASSKSGENVDKIFEGISNSILSHQLGWSPDPRLSTGSVPRRSPRPSVLIRQFSEKAGARTRSIRRSLRRRSLKVKTSKTPSDDVTDKKKNRRRFSESDLPKILHEKEQTQQRSKRSGRPKTTCAIL